MDGGAFETMWTRSAMDAQLGILDADSYDLMLVPRRAGLKKKKKHHFTADELLLRAPKLKLRNAWGYDIFIIPRSARFYYLLLDDIRPDERDTAILLKPAYILRTSEHSEQGIYRVPRPAFSEAAACALCGELNRALGDPHVSGAVHAFRLHGFMNRKPGRAEWRSAFSYQYTTHHIYGHGPERRLANGAGALIEWGKALDKKLSTTQPARQSTSTAAPLQLRPPADEVAAALDAALALVAPHCDGDRSREDYNAVGVLVRKGCYQRDELVAALHARSGRKAQPQAYAERTVDKVIHAYQAYQEKHNGR